MRTRITLQLAAVAVICLASTANGLFFHYSKNALMDFFESLHHKHEAKKQNIHHYHVHYYPVKTQIIKPFKAPEKYELDKWHSNHLESLGWNEHEYQHVPEPEIYQSSPPHDPWSQPSNNDPSIWDDEISSYPQKIMEQPETPKAGLIVQVPINQKIVVQNPKEEQQSSNPILSLIRGIKNSIFSQSRESDRSEDWGKSSMENFKTFVVYMDPGMGRKL